MFDVFAVLVENDKRKGLASDGKRVYRLGDEKPDPLDESERVVEYLQLGRGKVTGNARAVIRSETGVGEKGRDPFFDLTPVFFIQRVYDRPIIEKDCFEIEGADVNT